MARFTLTACLMVALVPALASAGDKESTKNYFDGSTTAKLDLCRLSEC